jgi:hypothetical protein
VYHSVEYGLLPEVVLLPNSTIFAVPVGPPCLTTETMVKGTVVDIVLVKVKYWLDAAMN